MLHANVELTRQNSYQTKFVRPQIEITGATSQWLP